jgi:hypothetical protein
MKTYRQIAQICSVGIFLAANATRAESPPAFSEGFEDQECQVTYSEGDRAHHQLNRVAVVTEQVHSGKQSCMIDVATDGDYSSSFLYLCGERLHVMPEPGQKLEGWMKVDPATSEGVAVNLGISVIFPQKTATPTSAQLPLAIVEQGADGWQKFQSQDLLEFYTNLAAKKDWNPEGLFVERWLLHLTGADLKNKRVVVYIDDVVIR